MIKVQTLFNTTDDQLASLLTEGWQVIGVYFQPTRFDRDTNTISGDEVIILSKLEPL